MIFKNIMRQIRRSLGRFIAIFAIVALGVGFFVGLRVSKDAMVKTGENYFEELKLFDFRLVSTLGLTQEDVTEIGKLDQVAYAVGSVSADLMYVQSSGANGVLHMHSILPNMNLVDLQAGRMPESDDECVLDGKFNSSDMIGSYIELSPDNSESTFDTFKYDKYKVVGVVNSPYYANFERGSSSLGGVSGYAYILPEGFVSDCYTEIFVRLEDHPEIYSDECDEYVEKCENIISPVLEKRGEIRYEALKAEAYEKIHDAEAELDEGKGEYEEKKSEALAEIADAQEKIDNGAEELADAREKIENGLAEIEDARAELADGMEQLAEARKQIASGEEQIAEAKEKLEAGFAQVNEGKETLAGAKSQAEAARTQLEAGKSQYEAAKAQLEEGKSQYAEAKNQLEAGKSQYEVAKAQLEAGKSQYEEAKNQYEAASAMLPDDVAKEQKQTLETTAAYLTEQKQILAEQGAYLEEQEQILAEQGAYLEEQEQVLTEQGAYLSEQETLLAGQEAYIAEQETLLIENENYLLEQQTELKNQEQNLVAQKNTLKEKEKELIDSKYLFTEKENEIAEAQTEIAEKTAELEDAKVTLEEKKQEAYEEFEKAEEELEDAQQEIDEAYEKIDKELKSPSVFVLGRSTNVGYASLENDSDILAGVAKVFPLFFFIVASLVCVTTMTRMVAEQRVQNGTLKALGYSNFTIAGQYLFYAGTASVTGCIVGFLLGSKLMPMVLWKIYHIMYSIDRPIVYLLDYSLFAFCAILYLVATLGATWMAAAGDLKEVAAELIRPKAPVPGKRVLLERISFIWKRIKFLHKVSIRNIFLFKKRMFMMIIGVGGCTALLLTGFGIRDSIQPILDYQFNEIHVYDMVVSYLHEQTKENQADFTDKYGEEIETFAFLHQESMDLMTNNSSDSVTLVGADKLDSSLVNLHNGDEVYSWPGLDETIIDYRLAKDNGISIGDTIEFRDADYNVLRLKVVGIFDNYLRDYAYISTETYERQLGKQLEINTAYVNAAAGRDANEVASDFLSDSEVTAVTVMENQIKLVGNMLSSLDYVVLIVLVCAGALAFIVIYNLTNISINERIREIATIKVLGFYESESAAYVFRENLVLTIISAIIGLPMGVALHRYVMSQIRIKSMYFGHRILPTSFIWAVVLTFAFAVVVDIFMYFKLKKINMAESLKAVD